MRKRYCKACWRASSFSREEISFERGRILHNHTDGLMHSLGEPIFWIAAVLCVVAELAILRYAFAPPTDPGSQSGVPQSPRGLEMIWAIIPAVILAMLLAATWRAVH